MSSLVTYGKHIRVDTYYDGQVTGTNEEVELIVNVDQKQDLLKHIIDALSVVNSGASNKLCLEIQVDKHGRLRLIKRWKVVI